MNENVYVIAQGSIFFYEGVKKNKKNSFMKSGKTAGGCYSKKGERSGNSFIKK